MDETAALTEFLIPPELEHAFASLDGPSISVCAI